jgi:hypothetical protein
MMKTPEEIKKGLECGDCKNCPYKRLLCCTEGVREDALDYIQQLEAQNAELKREMAAAVNDLTQSRFCHACKHREEKEQLNEHYDTPSQCINCHLERSQFLWRGPLPEPPKEE